MQLKLEKLQRVVKSTIKEERSHAVLREELFRVFGSPVMVSSNIDKVAEAVNEHLDVFEATGKSVRREDIKLTALIEASSSKLSSVRKVAARLLPERHAIKMLSDKDSSVRCAAARRASAALVKEAYKRNPGDETLRNILKDKRLAEAGVPDPKPQVEPFDMYGEKPLGTAVKQKPGDDLTDGWYVRLAHKLCREYGTNLEGQWEEPLATRIVASHYSTTGVMLDREKLLQAIYDCLKEREEAVLGEGSLKALAARLMKESYLDDAVMPVIEVTHDPMVDLLETSHSSRTYVEAAEKIFSVKKSNLPAGIKKYRIGEGYRNETKVPVNAKIPGGHLTPRIEKALDVYVESWNKMQAQQGEPYRLSWGSHAASFDMIGFHLELK